ncbi:MAG: hypothetical protein WC869_09325 [Phycisphaerae bacterium]
MLRIDRNKKSLMPMKSTTLGEAEITERYHLQRLIANNPEAFFEELGESLLLLGEEVRPTDVVDDRIDLLAVGKEGEAVVIELKRGSNRLQLLQALSYAAMISKWQPQQLIELRRTFVGQAAEEAQELIEGFLEVDIGTLNASQRLILIAEAFDYQVLATAEWLSERFEVDIRCYQLSLAADAGLEYLSCACIYPAPELRERTKQGNNGTVLRWGSWDEALAVSDNDVLKEFFRNEIAAGCEKNLNGRSVIYRDSAKKRRFFVHIRKSDSYVWQEGRFSGDVDFWKATLDPSQVVDVVGGGRCVRFYLTSDSEFKRFKEFVTEKLPCTQFLSGALPEAEEQRN